MDPTLVVLASFIIFIAIAYRLGYQRSMATLDCEIKLIRQSLEDAEQAREDAVQALAEERHRHREIQDEIKLVEQRAEEQVRILQEQALEDIQKTIKSRQKTARDMIERMQSEAIQAIREEIAATTVAALEELVTTHLSTTQQEKVNDNAIDQVIAQLAEKTTTPAVKTRRARTKRSEISPSQPVL